MSETSNSDYRRFDKVSKPQRHRGPASRMMPGEKPRDFKKTMKSVFSLLGKYKVALFFTVVFAIGSCVFNIFGPKVLSLATTELFNGAVAKINGVGKINFDIILAVLICSLVLYILSALCSFIQGWLMSSVSQKMSYKLRQDIVNKFNRLPFGFFEKNAIGDALSRITNDVDTLAQSLSHSVTQLITSIATFVGILIMMFYINPLMTCIALVSIPIVGILIVIIVKISQKYFRLQQQLLGSVNTVVEETISGHDVVRAFNQQEKFMKKFNETNSTLRSASWKAQYASSFTKPALDFVANLSYVVVAICGSYFAITGAITVGDIQAFIQYVKNLNQPISQLAQISNIIQQMAAAAERIFEFLELDEEAIDEDKLTDDLSSFDVEFEHVSFGYDPDSKVINDFSIPIKQGQTVALVGATGAGKTTLVKLLMRFYDVWSGSIKIGGVDIRDLSKNTVRNNISMVLQDTWLFNGSVKDNLKYGRLDATDDEVIQAAKSGCAHHFIETLPDGYNYVINEEADNISQGQRQLLTIARAILANRNILILDEATSCVDTRTERRIQEAMDNLMAQKTSFVIAHRLSTIVNADLILVIDSGDIVEHGTHSQLLEKNGVYAQLYNFQFSEC